MTESSRAPEPTPDPDRPRGVRGALVFGVVAATIQMAVILALAYC